MIEELKGKIPQGVKQLEVRKHHTTHALPCIKCNFNVTQDQLNQLQEDEELLEYKLSSIVDNIPNLKSDKLILDLLDQCKVLILTYSDVLISSREQ